MALPNTIALDVGSQSKTLEANAASGTNILPGTLLSYNSSGGFVEYSHGVDTVAGLIVAVEDTSTGGGLEDLYIPGNKVYARHMRPGDLFQIRHTASLATTGNMLASSATAGQMDEATTVNVGMAVSMETRTPGANTLLTVFAK